MPETPEEFHARVDGSLQAPEVETWDTWPFEGPVLPRVLAPPVEQEKPRHGEGGVDCGRCAAGDDAYVWTNERWRLFGFPRPAGLPVIVLLEPREHYEESEYTEADSHVAESDVAYGEHYAATEHDASFGELDYLREHFDADFAHGDFSNFAQDSGQQELSAVSK